MYRRKSGSLLVAACLLLLLFSLRTSAGFVGSRIVGGNYLHISQAPYTVQIRLLNRTFCAGTLIDPLLVLTAGHCFKGIRANNFQFLRVVGGANTRHEIGEQRRIAQMRTHDLNKEHEESFDYDCAVLKLESPMIGKHIRPVQMASTPPVPGEMVEVSGWGDTTYNGESSYELLSVQIPVIPREQCQSFYNRSITPNMFCAFDPHKDSCQGDSGGPAMSKGKLCGIVSFGVGCASGYPGVYTDINAMKPHIWKSIKSMLK